MTNPDPRPPDDRLESWKEIAAYLRRDVTTVQRWEKREGMPVHRHQHDKLGSVYAFRSDLDAWVRNRGVSEGPQPAPPAPDVPVPRVSELAAAPPAVREARRPGPWAVVAVAAAIVAASAVLLTRRKPEANAGLANARFVQLTDWGGAEQAAAISRDGRFVAFLSDRDGRMDVWVSQVGTGQFVNLTHGAAPEIVNASIRALGFSPDGTRVTYWARESGGSRKPEIGIREVPLLGGAARPYLDGVAEFDWSGDASRLVFHTPGPGDPMFVREPGPPAREHKLYTAPEGLHGHFPLWSPDQAHIWFVQGSLPDHLDLWRIPPAGGTPERMTHHDSRVSHPVFLDDRTLLYLAADADGSGPWISSLDTLTQVTRRLSFGIERYTSLAASADGRRIVATRASTRKTLWRVPVAGTRAEMREARRIPLGTGNGTFPRWGPGFLVYASSTSGGDALWKLQDGVAAELWSAPEAKIIGAPAVRRDGSAIAFPVQLGDKTLLYVVNADGSRARSLTSALSLKGSPAWAPDGRSLTIAALVDGTLRLHTVPLDGQPPAQFAAEYSTDPAWSADGELVAFSGADVGTTFPVWAADARGNARALPQLNLTRGARHVSFLPQERKLLVLRGQIRHKNLWLIDLETGAEQQVTDLPADFDVSDYDLSPGGRELVLEQVREASDVVLIERPRP